MFCKHMISVVEVVLSCLLPAAPPLTWTLGSFLCCVSGESPAELFMWKRQTSEKVQTKLYRHSPEFMSRAQHGALCVEVEALVKGQLWAPSVSQMEICLDLSKLKVFHVHFHPLTSDGGKNNTRCQLAVVGVITDLCIQQSFAVFSTGFDWHNPKLWIACWCWKHWALAMGESHNRGRIRKLAREQSWVIL